MVMHGDGDSDGDGYQDDQSRPDSTFTELRWADLRPGLPEPRLQRAARTRLLLHSAVYQNGSYRATAATPSLL